VRMRYCSNDKFARVMGRHSHEGGNPDKLIKLESESCNARLDSHLRGNDRALRFIAFCSATALSISFAYAADVNLELSPRKITVGDPIEMTLAVTPPPGFKVVWPIGEQLAPAEMIKMDTSASKPGRASIRYTISLFETGKQELPTLPVLLVSTERTDTLWVDPGIIQVAETFSERDSTLRDIRPPVRLPWTFKEMLPYLIGAVVALGGAALAWYLWRKAKLRRGEIPAYVPPPPPPDVIALRKLEELRVKKLWQDGRAKEYHSELTEIIKEYIGARYAFNALEMTSEELLAARDKWAVDDDALSRIRRIVNIADFVKFAKFRPDPHDHEKSLELAFAHIEATRAKSTTIAEAKEESR